MNQPKITFSDRLSTPQTILCDLLKYTRDADQSQDAKVIQDTGYTPSPKNLMILMATSIQAHENGGAIFILKKRTCDSSLSMITTNAEPGLLLHIFLRSIKRYPVLTIKKIIKMYSPFHRVSP